MKKGTFWNGKMAFSGEIKGIFSSFMATTARLLTDLQVVIMKLYKVI